MTIEIPNPADLDALALARRSGWPEDLRVLVARYPREQWDAHPNLGEMARFWLSRHAMFRELSDAIEQIATDLDHYYEKPNPGQLNTIFTQIAADLQRPAARLIDDGLQ